MVWTSANGPKCPVSPEDRGEAANMVVIDYTNWRGERAFRRIIPIEIVFAPRGTEFHDAPGWYLRAYDADKKGARDFAMADIHSWKTDCALSRPDRGGAA